MRRQKVLLAISMLGRVGVGMVSLLVLAHGLGAADYGFVVTVVAYSTIAALLADFGFGTQAMRDIAEDPPRAGAIMVECLRVKIILTVVATAIALFSLSIMELKPVLFWSSFMIYASIMILSYGDLAMVALRGIGRYEIETASVLLGSAFFAVVVTAAAFLAPGLWQLSAALLVARIGQTTIAFLSVTRLVTLQGWVSSSADRVIHFVRTSSPLALDTVLTVLIQQIDVIIVTALLGVEVAAAYQVASRLAMYFLLPMQVLAGVYIPRLSADARLGRAIALKTEYRMMTEFIVIGVLLGATFTVVPSLFALALPEDFQVSINIAIALGIFIMLRCIAAAFGSILVVYRRTDLRLVGQAVGFILLLLSMPFGLLLYGLTAAPWSLALAALGTLASYGHSWLKVSRVARSG